MDQNPNDINETHDKSLAAFSREQLNQTNQSRANSYTQDALPAAKGLLNADDNFNGGLSYGDKATSQAIKSRYAQGYHQSENKLKLDMIKGAQADHIHALGVASKAAGLEVEQNRQKMQLKWKIEQANKKARGAVVGEVLGITAGIVAGVYTGGAGAAAGYSAGKGVGQAVGEG